MYLVMKRIALPLIALLLVAACSTRQQVEDDPMKRLSLADISVSIINPDSLTVYEVDFENDKAVSLQANKLPRPDVLGFIGDFDRFRIKFTKVKKTVGLIYSVEGRWSWIGDNDFLKDFKGTIYIDSVKVLPPMWDYEEEFNSFIHRTECGMIYATVELNDENGNSWKGRAAYEYDVVDGQYHYSTLSLQADGYSNNAYEGVMTTKEGAKVCNWGDFRIPGSGSHDTGCGEFSPRGGRGWENYDMISQDPLLSELDRDWAANGYISWKEKDWAYEKVLETCYLKIVRNQALTREDILALVPQTSTQFWQFWDSAHQTEDGYGRDYYLDEAVMDEMYNGNFEFIEQFLPACWKWSDGFVAEDICEVDYQLWKKYPNQIEALAMKHNYLKVLKGVIEMMKEYETE